MRKSTLTLSRIRRAFLIACLGGFLLTAALWLLTPASPSFRFLASSKPDVMQRGPWFDIVLVAGRIKIFAAWRGQWQSSNHMDIHSSEWTQTHDRSVYFSSSSPNRFELSMLGFSTWLSSLPLVLTDAQCEVGATVGPCPRQSANRHLLFLEIPFWMLLILVAAYPIISLLCAPRRKRGWRLEHGLCLKCGYNLAGLTEPRCPECGTQFVPAVAESRPTAP